MREDRDVLRDAYLAVTSEIRHGSGVTDPEGRIKNAHAKARRLLLCLNGVGDLPVPEFKKFILNAKLLITELAELSCVTQSKDSRKMLKKDKTDLIDTVSRHEAAFIKAVQDQDPDGYKIDLSVLFNSNVKRHKLTSDMADELLMKAICGDGESEASINSHDLYITKTGKKYHFENCPRCRGKEVRICHRSYAELLHLQPCGCVPEWFAKARVDSDVVTVFIDESVRSNVSEANNIGYYSYIVCNGFVEGRIFKVIATCDR